MTMTDLCSGGGKQRICFSSLDFLPNSTPIKQISPCSLQGAGTWSWHKFHSVQPRYTNTLKYDFHKFKNIIMWFQNFVNCLGPSKNDVTKFLVFMIHPNHIKHLLMSPWSAYVGQPYYCEIQNKSDKGVKTKVHTRNCLEMDTFFGFYSALPSSVEFLDFFYSLPWLNGVWQENDFSKYSLLKKSYYHVKATKFGCACPQNRLS